MSEKKKKELPAEADLEEICGSNITDDDFILASQVSGQEVRRGNKIKLVKSYSKLSDFVTNISVSYDSDATFFNSSKILPQSSTCKNIRNEKEVSMDLKLHSDFIKSTQDDIFFSQVNLNNGKKKLKLFQSSGNKEVDSLFKSSLSSQKEVDIFPNDSYEIQGLFETLENHKNDITSNNQSKSVSTSDITESVNSEEQNTNEELLVSHNDESIASSFILPTQPSWSREINKNNFTINFERFYPNKTKEKMSQNLIHHNKCLSIDTSIKIEEKKINIDLSVSCLVMWNLTTKKIIQKFILSVDEFHNSSEANTLKKYSASAKNVSVIPSAQLNPSIFNKFDSSNLDDKIQEYSEKLSGDLKWNNEYLLPLKLNELTINAMNNASESSMNHLNMTNYKEPNLFSALDVTFEAKDNELFSNKQNDSEDANARNFSSEKNKSANLFFESSSSEGI